MSTTNRPLVLASTLFFGTAAIHGLIGGPEINAPVQISTLDPVVRAVSAVVWHALTAIFTVLAAALLWVARYPNRTVLVLILGITLCFTALFLSIGITTLGSVWPMPQWILFTAIAGVLLWGLKRTPNGA